MFTQPFFSCPLFVPFLLSPATSSSSSHCAAFDRRRPLLRSLRDGAIHPQGLRLAAGGEIYFRVCVPPSGPRASQRQKTINKTAAACPHLEQEAEAFRRRFSPRGELHNDCAALRFLPTPFPVLAYTVSGAAPPLSRSHVHHIARLLCSEPHVYCNRWCLLPTPGSSGAPRRAWAPTSAPSPP